MTALEKKITENIWRFEPISLLLLLNHLGYGMEQILFRSHFSLSSQARLIQAIEFRPEPHNKVVLTLNLGFLVGQSLLPNYMFKQVHDDTIGEQRFAEFFGYFDDRVLRRFLLAIYPECDDSLSPKWADRTSTALHTLRLDSVVTLHWLTQLVFPELQVKVEKVTLERRIDLGAPILGKSQLGYQTVLGKIKQMPVPGKRISLIAEEADFKVGLPWANEIDRRLQNLMFPILQAVGLDLEIWLTIRNQSTWLSLQENSYLGYESVFSETSQARAIRIFSGLIV